MKRIILSIVAIVILASLSVKAQTPSLQMLKWRGSQTVMRVAMFCPTDGNYNPIQIGTANDTSAVYVLPEYWDQMWLINKPWQLTANEDSVDIPTYVQYRLQHEVVTGTRYMGWITADSSDVTTADTMGGDVKQITGVPPNASAIRIYWDGVSGNEATAGNKIKSWLIFTRAKP